MMNALSIITSLGCSLKCDYCYLAKDEEKLQNLQLQQANIQALKNGTFLKNIKKVLINSEIFPESITSIAFWGMEPTLTLKYITQNIEEWFKLFPNWNMCFFSTNGQQNYQDIINFAKVTGQHSATPFRIDMQVSYDGEKFTNLHRHTKKDNYLHELQKYINDQIKEEDNYNFYLDIFPHGVLTHDVIKYLLNLSLDELVEYFELEKQNSFQNQFNKYFRFRSNIGYAIENPCWHSSEDGKEIAKLINRMLDSNYDILKLQGLEFIGTCGMGFIKYPPNLTLPINELMTYCGNFTERFHIRYDGVVVQCAAFPFKDKINNLPLIKYNFFYDINKNIPKNIYDNYWQTLNYESNIFQYNNIKNNIKILAKYGEIDPIYLTLDEQILNQHIRYIMFHNSCLHGFYSLTNTATLNPISHIKFYCNGLAFLLDQYLYKLTQDGWMNIKYDIE